MPFFEPKQPGTQNSQRVTVPRKDWQDLGFMESMFQWQTRWPNFRPQELACKCCGTLEVHYKALDGLQSLRKQWGSPIQITSATRCTKHNNRVGGAKDSYHLKGMAFDIYNQPWAGKHVASFIYHATHFGGFRGFGLYTGFIHIDIGPARTWEQGDERLDPFDNMDPNELE